MNPQSLRTTDLHPLPLIFSVSFYSFAHRTQYFNNTKQNHSGAVKFHDYLQLLKLGRYFLKITLFWKSLKLTQNHKNIKVFSHTLHPVPPKDYILYNHKCHQNQEADIGWTDNTSTQVVLFIFTHSIFQVQTVPNLQCFNLWFFDFTMLQKQYKFSKNHTSNFEFGSFPRLAICGTIFSCDAGQWQQVTAPSQTCNHGGKQLMHLQRFCTHTTISVFTVSTILNKLHEIFSTLLQNRHHIRWFCPTAG